MSTQPPKSTGLSLYANLLESEASTTTPVASGASVHYSQSGASNSAGAKKKPLDSAALRFQPIRRAVPPKQKPKSTFPKPTSATTAADSAPHIAVPAAVPAAAPTAAPAKSRLADWAPTEEDEWLYGTGEKRQRGGRKNKKRRENDHHHHQQRETDWDDVYDPSRPTNVDEYMHSHERVDEVREWKGLLYSHRAAAPTSPSRSRSASRQPDWRDAQSGDDAERRQGEAAGAEIIPAKAAPPPNSPPRSRPVPVDVPNDVSGDDVYARRLAMAQAASASASASASAPAGIVAASAPITYTQPPTVEPTYDSADDAEEDWADERSGLGAPRANRPGQAGFAKRIMSKYGWTRGTGLGASSDGITSALAVQVGARRKRPDAAGGGWTEPQAARTVVTGGQRSAQDGGSRYGKMSAVVVLRGMLDGMRDVAGEIEAGLGQEIGEECGDKYGRVDRLYIDQKTRQVFIKFTDQISALRAVSELDGRIFNGNTIRPAYFDPDQFDAGIFTPSSS